MGVLSVAGRYQTDDMAISGTLGNSGQLHASFYQKCSENLQIGVEMETNFKVQVRNRMFFEYSEIGFL